MGRVRAHLAAAEGVKGAVPTLEEVRGEEDPQIYRGHPREAGPRWPLPVRDLLSRP